MRPHLEQWQARFRTWLAAGGNRALAPGLPPQEMQSQFPEWTALSRDLLAANQRLGGYLTSLEAMVAETGKKPAGQRTSGRKRPRNPRDGQKRTGAAAHSHAKRLRQSPSAARTG